LSETAVTGIGEIEKVAPFILFGLCRRLLRDFKLYMIVVNRDRSPLAIFDVIATFSLTIAAGDEQAGKSEAEETAQKSFSQ